MLVSVDKIVDLIIVESGELGRVPFVIILLPISEKVAEKMPMVKRKEKN